MLDLRENVKIGTDGASLDGSIERLLNLFYQRNELKEPINNHYYEGNRIRNFYPQDNEDNVFEANEYLFGNNLGGGTTFGVTFIYGGKIVILDSLRGEDRKKVLEHEKHHKENPADSEAMTRLKTFTEYFEPNPIVSPVKY